MLRVKHYIAYVFSVLVVLAASQPFAYASNNSAFNAANSHCQSASQMQTEHCKHMAAMAQMEGMHASMSMPTPLAMSMHENMPMDCCESGDCTMDHCIGSTLFVGSSSLNTLSVAAVVYSSNETIHSPSSAPNNLYRPPIV